MFHQWNRNHLLGEAYRWARLIVFKVRGALLTLVVEHCVNDSTRSVLNLEWFVVPGHFLLPLQHDGLHHRVHKKQSHSVRMLEGVFARFNYWQRAVNRKFRVDHLLHMVVDLLNLWTVWPTAARVSRFLTYLETPQALNVIHHPHIFLFFMLTCDGFQIVLYASFHFSVLLKQLLCLCNNSLVVLFQHIHHKLRPVANGLYAALYQVAVQTMNLSGFQSLLASTISVSRRLVQSAHLVSNCQLLENLCLFHQKIFFEFLVPSFFFLQTLLGILYQL